MGELPGFRIKTGDLEIEFYSSEISEVHNRFNDVMDWLIELKKPKSKRARK